MIDRVNSPLVSVCVISYNSASFIVETLESIKRQSYKNVELIISDDCSSDNTLEVCKKWLDEYAPRFIRVELLTTPVNGGIPSNYNRAAKACTGEWKKIIAADDLLADDCIEQNINYVSAHPYVDVLFADIKFLVENSKGEYGIQDHKKEKEKLRCFEMPVEQQLAAMYNETFCYTPTFFVRNAVDVKYPCNEKYKLMEDYPHWIDLLEAGYRFYYMDEPTVLYRIHNSASQDTTAFVNERHIEMLKVHFYNELYEKLKSNYPEIWRNKLRNFLIYDFEIYILRNKINFFTRLINSVFCRLVKV